MMSNVVTMPTSESSLFEGVSDIALCRSLLREYYKNGGEYLDSFDHLDLKIFNESEHGYAIRQMSKGMSIIEIMDSFNLLWEFLSKEDQLFVACMFLQGRAESIQTATQSLFDVMKVDDKGNAAINYLARFGEEWAKEVSNAEVPLQGLEIRVVSKDQN